ncbi:acetyl-CoA C-acetyltransferase [Pelagibacterium halotolerans]|uniref:3-ketoacyl-CoA thiolase / acetyl-CoA acetyltransferase n=1 Tax=Pelagibacterium halotolerans (strain DSM 22347 / JCM 15775 / CGMCC 1.7692 / B2) TaxID=1082931 RepID=G4RA05_PELHB|nr:acetyl-CoA C-acetyltransferase [Pelagibacterium halotolerans]AEQ52532.1 3-ketoacyl-CoA thiolase / acetyl-CoA acetyltransferase [Pelagibacterium halotolerans B2]QJR17747.1 acetyl-CoA C-acetyltransferase [Pelagibacterium halotolerans]SEA39280.1 3-ketoacyl-CoA thiolase [Pelagibacterium halotolerans]
MTLTLRKVAIVGSARIPFCRAYTGYENETNLSMLSTAIGGLADKYGLKGQRVGEVMAGSVISHSKDFNLAREALLDAGLSPQTPGTTVQIACGTSLQAALMLGAKIATGEIDSGIAAGSDTVSDSPVVLGPKMQKRMIALSRARTTGEKFSAFKGFNFGEIAPVAPSTQEPRTGLSMGEHCELMAKQWGISREAQDLLALRSHQNAAAAYDAGFHDDLIVPCAGIYKDNNVRPDASLEKMATMKPAFDKKSGKGTLTAANSTPLTDGASSVLLASEDWARERGLPILGYLTMGAVSANDFAHGDGLLMAPTIAVSDLMRRSGLGFADIDLFELHEAFAAQVLCTLAAWEDPDYNRAVLGRDDPLGAVPVDKINVFGSSLAYGHPFAATGARILGMTAKLLNTQEKNRALISVCTAGGMGVAAIVERAN